jgi:hypothetical protein
MGLHGTAGPRAGQRRGPGQPLGLPARTLHSELHSLLGQACADRVAHLETFSIAGGIAGAGILGRRLAQGNHLRA